MQHRLSNSDGLVIGYLYKDINGDFVPFNDQAIASFRSGMTHCFQHAVKKGLSISIVPVRSRMLYPPGTMLFPDNV